MKYWITDGNGNVWYIWELSKDVSKIGRIKNKIVGKIVYGKEHLLEKISKYFVRNTVEN